VKIDFPSYVQVSREFGHKKTQLIILIESLAGNDCYLRDDNDLLSTFSAYPISSIPRILRELELAGWIVQVNGLDGKRMGILLKRRIDQDLPVVSTPEEFMIAVQSLTWASEAIRQARERERASLPTFGESGDRGAF
jgi:hypothetical protein